MILKRIEAPEIEPVSLDEAKSHLRVDTNDDDVLITALIAAAREYVEDASRRALITQEWRLSLEGWPCDQIVLPRPPLQSVEKLEYTDSDGTTTEVDDALYDVDTDSEPGRIKLAYGQTWPGDTLATLNPIQVEFTAGYGDEAADVPQHLRQAILLLVGHWYENREATTVGEVSRETPLAVQSLIFLNRVY